MINILCTILLFCWACQSFNPPPPPFPIFDHEIPPAYWERLAREKIKVAEKLFPDFQKATKKAKNVILFLGDGMGLPTIAASRFYNAEVTNSFGEAIPHVMEEWDFNTECRTYDLETMVTDSASSATAYLTGTKTRTGMLGLTGAVYQKQCTKYTEKEKLESVIKAAANAGKRTGIITTARITHASPAGAFGHVAYREWEDDSEVAKQCTGPKCLCTDLAYQVAYDNYDVNVWLGGGQRNFFSTDSILPADPSQNGRRLIGKNLMAAWTKGQQKKGRNPVTIDTIEKFRATDFTKAEYVLGLPYPDHIPYMLDRKPNDLDLVDFLVAAINSLKQGENGFVLFVEGARIDHAHHENRAQKAMSEMREFENSVKKAMTMVNLDETLMLLTADHSHSFELVGQPSRFDSIFLKDKGKGPTALDKKGMIPVGYMTGPGAVINGTRANVTAMDKSLLTNKDFQQQALIPNAWATHAGEDVSVYANGPFSYLFHSTVDNTFVAQAMKFAACIKPYDKEPHCPTDKASVSVHASFLTTTFVLFVCIFSRQ